MLLYDRSVLQMKSQAALLTNPNGQLTFNDKWDSALNFSRPFHFVLIGRKQSEFGLTENSLWMAQTLRKYCGWDHLILKTFLSTSLVL